MASYVSIEPNEIYFDNSGGSDIISISIDRDIIGSGWEIGVYNDMWCEVRIAERYQTNTTIVINVPANPEPEIRVMDLDVMFDGEIVGNIHVEQEALVIVNTYTIAPTTYKFTPAGGVKSGTIISTSNSSTYEVVSKPDWITATFTYRDYNTTLTLTATKNSGDEVRSGNIAITSNDGVYIYADVTQETNAPTISEEYWSIPPMFMDGIENIYYTNLSGETSSYEDSGIVRTEGIYTHALCNTPYYDNDIRLYFADEENKPIDGSDVLVFYSKDNYFNDDFKEKYYVNLTDDIPEMMDLNEGESCWIYSLTNTNVAGETISIPVTQYPQFSRYITDIQNNVLYNFDLGNPVMDYTLNVQLKEDTDIYGQYWKKFLTDQYSRDTRILECYVRIPYGLMQDYLRNFFYFENSYWVLIEVVDYKLTKEQSCKCKFIKVNDINNYTNGQII